MPKFRKTIKSSCFYIAWLALFSSYQTNVVSAHKLKLVSADDRPAISLKADTNQGNLTIKSRSSQVFLLKPSSIFSSLNKQAYSATSLLMTANSEPTPTNTGKSQFKLNRLFPPSFFLILFTSCGIFYPLFLFYRKLLGTEKKLNQFNNFLEYDNQKRPDILVGLRNNREEQPGESTSDLPSDNLWRTGNSRVISSFETPAKTESATVSKLQIAFSPQAIKLRQKLSQISCSADSNQEQDVVDLLCKTVLALVSHQNWTHANHSSMSLALDQAKAEFDLISQTERKKCLTRELSLVNHNHLANSNSSEQKGDYRYVVVTLILWTTHNSSLFTKIYTEEQLIKELGKLSKIRRESLLKFELLWNPQQEASYLKNEQLLTEYSDLNRLL